MTVSPGYAWEIQTPEGGWGMEGLLGGRAYALNGVLNGIDGTEWSPESDPHLPRRYGRSNFSRGKAECKAALQAELGLPLRPEARRATPPRPCCASCAGGLPLPPPAELRRRPWPGPRAMVSCAAAHAED